MIYNEETYYIGYHKNVRELGALPAVAFDTIAGLLRPNGGIGDIANSTLCDLLGISDKGLRNIISKLIEHGYLDKVQGNGRTNKTTYVLTKKGEQSSVFLAEKGGTNYKKRGNKVPLKGEQSTAINTELNKEYKEYLSSFEVQSPSNDEREEEKILIEENIHKSEITQEDENAAVEAVKSLFAADEEKIAPETKSSFAEFWKLFAPDERQQCKYKVSLKYWNDEMPENWRAAAIELLRRGARPNQDNPYFFLQHFSPVKYFLDEREQYIAYKQGVQLCSVRWNRDQRVMSAMFAEVFKMEIIDNHYERKFE